VGTRRNARAGPAAGVAAVESQFPGAPVPLEARYRRDSLDTIRTTVGKEQFGRAYAKGMTLSLDQALDLALGTARPA
jgi:hypothetical protein